MNKEQLAPPHSLCPEAAVVNVTFRERISKKQNPNCSKITTERTNAVHANLGEKKEERQQIKSQERSLSL